MRHIEMLFEFKTKVSIKDFVKTLLLDNCSISTFETQESYHDYFRNIFYHRKISFSVLFIANKCECEKMKKISMNYKITHEMCTKHANYVPENPVEAELKLRHNYEILKETAFGYQPNMQSNDDVYYLVEISGVDDDCKHGEMYAKHAIQDVLLLFKFKEYEKIREFVKTAILIYSTNLEHIQIILKTMRNKNIQQYFKRAILLIRSHKKAEISCIQF